MKILEFIYNEKSISFDSTGNDNVMVNATEMAKVFGKDLFQFTKSDATKKFISACLKPAFAGLLNLKSEEDLIISRQKSGTWMHRILALKFAAWLDPEFEVWVWTTIDQIILGHYREMKEATVEKLKAEKEWKDKKEKLIRENPQLAEVFEAELKISAADRKRMKAMKAATDQLKFDLFGDDKEKRK